MEGWIDFYCKPWSNQEEWPQLGLPYLPFLSMQAAFEIWHGVQPSSNRPSELADSAQQLFLHKPFYIGTFRKGNGRDSKQKQGFCFSPPKYYFYVSRLLYQPKELTRLALKVITGAHSLIHELFHAILTESHVLFANQFGFGQRFSFFGSWSNG